MWYKKFYSQRFEFEGYKNEFLSHKSGFVLFQEIDQ